MERTIVYLIRHSEQLKIEGTKNIKEESQINNEKIVLSVKGEMKARELSELEEFNNIDVIWSSNYVRAVATAKYIAYRNNLPINIDTNFNERKLGNLETLRELGKDKKHTYTEEQLMDENLKNIDGENRIEVNKRMTTSLNKILKDNAGKKVVIVSHGAAIKFLLMNWCDLNENCKLVYNNSIIEVESPSAIKLEFRKENLENMTIIK
ncbi:MAG: histidine phosphatase family protein [Clostridia bacterium]|nr:histidine phosphatase family protein [Clostridia bacterium]